MKREKKSSKKEEKPGRSRRKKIPSTKLEGMILLAISTNYSQCYSNSIV